MRDEGRGTRGSEAMVGQPEQSRRQPLKHHACKTEEEK